MRPDMRPDDAYGVLGVAPGASRTEIRRAYRRRALEVHPDLAGSGSTAEMAALNDARDLLLGPVPGGAAEAGGEAQASRRRRSQPPPRPGGDHAPLWDDYWSAWNDPPRRPRA